MCLRAAPVLLRVTHVTGWRLTLAAFAAFLVFAFSLLLSLLLSRLQSLDIFLQSELRESNEQNEETTKIINK
jgi:hypothetical protein